MRQFKLSEAGANGWFVGPFDKAIWQTSDFEVCYCFSPKGAITQKHIHKVAKELNLIASGRALINGVEFAAGDIFEIEPGEELYGEYLEDTYTVCIKVPGVLGDKYLV
ncbi:MAG TPA: hypothetical protein VFM18_18420 [Methanosarcina sp.]|nr:hypothetical protein [Methanosarcina sp.]